MHNNLGNAKECKTLIKHQLIKVNNQIITDYKYQVKFDDQITYNDNTLKAQPFNYYMLNKPAGYICANKDVIKKCVTDLIDGDCYCLGRLDQDTTGLLLLTNDPTLSKRLLLPQNHVSKTYLVTTKDVLDNNLISKFAGGIIIDKTVECLPAKLKIIDDHHCYITINEGKYHQIKKMFLSCQNEVIALKRIEFAKIKLDPSLNEGQYRCLNKEELELLWEN